MNISPNSSTNNQGGINLPKQPANQTLKANKQSHPAMSNQTTGLPLSERCLHFIFGSLTYLSTKFNQCNAQNTVPEATKHVTETPYNYLITTELTS